MYQLIDVGADVADTPVLKGLSVTVADGECLAVVGQGGVGKTTLLKVLAGLRAPDRGEVRFRGEPLHGTDRRLLARRIGMAFQHGGLFDSLPVGENLAFPLREVLGLAAAEAAPRVTRALAEVGLAGTEALAVRELSGGMQKRLGIARALCLEPEVMLLDDPTAGLDPVTSRSILDLIREAKERHRMTVVLVVSDPALAYGLADRIGFLHGGSFVELAPGDELRRSANPLVRQFIEGALSGPLAEPGFGSAPEDRA